MVEQLLDFDPMFIRPEDRLVTWKEIAGELGVSEDTLRRWCQAERIELPRMGPPSGKARVYLPKVKIAVLRAIFRV